MPWLKVWHAELILPRLHGGIDLMDLVFANQIPKPRGWG